MQLRAPLIMTMHGPALHDHAIGITGDRITYLLPIAEAPRDSEPIDLPHTTLIPGFVNAHCHMDLSHLRNRVPFQGSFTEWIRALVALRDPLTEDGIRRATGELQNSGVTTLVDHVGASSKLSHIIDIPLRKHLFLEVIGVTTETADNSLALQRQRARTLQDSGIAAIPSPHATYSVHPEVFQKMVPSGPLSIHCAESDEEWELFTQGRGNLWEFVRDLSHVTPANEPGSTFWMPAQGRHDKSNTPISYLSKNNLLPRSPWFAVHCNTLTDGDIALLKKSQATVVHCPRSHAFFNHPPFPLEKLRAASVPVAIGTDSLASCPNFDFLEELRALREEFGFLKTEDILEMACAPLTPALSPRGRGGVPVGAFADIIGLRSQNDLLAGPVTFSIIGGQRVI